MQDPHYTRAYVLHLQHRYDQALEELQLYLANQPDAADGHYLAAWCLWRLKRFEEATERVRDAISANPEWAPPFCLLARILKERNRLPEAKAAIEEALRLDPADPSNYVVQAIINIRRGEYEDAVMAAQSGLDINPTHDDCRSALALALSLLGRNEEALATGKEVLTDDPEGPFTHASRGWVLLRANQPSRAREHFLEALRHEPHYEWAREGLVMAMTRRRWLYRTIVLAEHWVDSLPSLLRIPLLVIVGVPLIAAVVSLCVKMPRLAAITLGLSAWTAWAWRPISLLLLRLDRFGRTILAPDETRVANVCGVISVTGWSGVLIGLFGPFAGPAFVGVVLLWLVRPLTDMMGCEAGKPRRMLLGYLTVLLCLGAALIGCNFVGAEAGRWPERVAKVFFIALFSLPFVSKHLAAMRMPR